MLRTIVKKENRVKAIVDLIDGVFYDDNLDIVPLIEVEQIIKNETTPIIVKPSIGSGGGRKVEYYEKTLYRIENEQLKIEKENAYKKSFNILQTALGFK